MHCLHVFSPPKREKEGESGGGNSERKHIGDETRAGQHRNTLSVEGCLTPVADIRLGWTPISGRREGWTALLLLETGDPRNDIGGEGGKIFVRAKLAFVFLFRGLMHRSIVDREVWNWCRLLLGGGAGICG